MYVASHNKWCQACTIWAHFVAEDFSEGKLSWTQARTEDPEKPKNQIAGALRRHLVAAYNEVCWATTLACLTQTVTHWSLEQKRSELRPKCDSIEGPWIHAAPPNH